MNLIKVPPLSQIKIRSHNALFLSIKLWIKEMINLASCFMSSIKQGHMQMIEDLPCCGQPHSFEIQSPADICQSSSTMAKI